MDFLKQFFKDYKKQIIISAVIIVVIIIIKRHEYKVARLFNPIAKKTSPYSENGEIPEERKLFVQGIAKDIYNDIESTPWTGHNYTSYDKANLLYDDEIIYLANYYKQNLSNGMSLFDAIDSQWYTWSSSPSELQAKLTGLNKR